MPITLNKKQRLKVKEIIYKIQNEARDGYGINSMQALRLVETVLAEIDLTENASDTITVIQVIQDGRVGYVANTSCLSVNAVVENAFDAIDYTGTPDNLIIDLDVLVTPFDKSYAKSGLRIDHLPVVVTMDMNGNVQNSYIGRMQHQ